MTETLDAQIDRLANFIMAEVPGEPSQSEGAVDTAIRWMRSALAARSAPEAGKAVDETAHDLVMRSVSLLSSLLMESPRFSTELNDKFFTLRDDMRQWLVNQADAALATPGCRALPSECAYEGEVADDHRTLARAAIEAIREPPVAWRWRHHFGRADQWEYGNEEPTGPSIHLFDVEPLFAALASSPAPTGACNEVADLDGLELAEHWMERAENAEIEAADLSRKLEEHQDAEDKAAREMATVIQGLRNRATAAERKLEEARRALEVIAASDDIENALDPARNKRVAARALSAQVEERE